MRSVLFVGLFLLLSLGATAQTITVSNLLNPDAPVARQTLALIEGQSFTDVEENDPIFAPTSLGGVTVRLDGVLQQIQSVAPTRVVIIVQGAGRAVREVELRTKFNVIHRVSIAVATVWPGLLVQNQASESELFYPFAQWTLDGVNRTIVSSDPIPVGPRSRPTLVILQGVGFRLGKASGDISVRLNGIPCTVASVNPSPLFVGQDELIFQLPTFLANNGVMDLTVSVAGRNANFARLNL
ncbi:MAG TPA: IPT/TIG domain-containing protein, partial [Blastocatellia bacterium]